MDEWTSTVWQVKNTLDNSINALHSIVVQNDIDMTRDQIETEFRSIALYVAGADNNISSDELKLINTLFDLNLTPSNITDLLKTMGEVYDALLVQLQLPAWQLSRALDKTLNSNDATDAYILTMRTLMEFVAASDGAMHPREEKLIEDFIARLERDRGHASPEPSASMKAPSLDPVEEIKKYKELLDQGILTQEEFDAKKKQLLGL